VAVTYLQFPIQVCFSATVDHHLPNSCFPPITFRPDLDTAKVNKQSKYLGQRTFSLLV